MMSLILLVAFFLLQGALTLPVAFFTAEGPSTHRRGVPYNNPNFVRLFDSPNSLIGWTYNWDSRTGNTNTGFEFVPMLHSLRTEHVAKWKGDVEQAANVGKSYPTHVLSFNEPDNCDPNGGGSCMSVGDAVAGWKQHIQPLKGIKDQIYLGSPAVTNGDGDQGLGWLQKFLDSCTGCSVDFINLHWYDSATNAAYFKSHIDNARRIAGGRPIWITEFKPSGSDEQIKAFLSDVIPWMDKSGDIHRYAYFMASQGAGLLVNGDGTGLSDVGAHYQTLSYQGSH